jgi:hypothetical protein
MEMIIVWNPEIFGKKITIGVIQKKNHLITRA